MPKRYKSEALGAIHETMAAVAKAGAISPKRMREFDRACLDEGEVAKSGLTFHVYKDDDARWRWRLVDAVGKTIATSAEAYRTKKDSVAAVELIKHARDARVVA